MNAYKRQNVFICYSHKDAKYLEQLQQQMMGVLDFHQAIKAGDWEKAEAILQKYPNLPEGHSLLGLSMSKEVRGYFIYQLHPGAYPQCDPFAPNHSNTGDERQRNLS